MSAIQIIECRRIEDTDRTIPARARDCTRGPTFQLLGVRNSKLMNTLEMRTSVPSETSFEKPDEDQPPIDIIDIIDHEQLLRLIFHHCSRTMNQSIP
jgi:hypothetical protein